MPSAWSLQIRKIHTAAVRRRLSHGGIGLHDVPAREEPGGGPRAGGEGLPHLLPGKSGVGVFRLKS